MPISFRKRHSPLGCAAIAAVAAALCAIPASAGEGVSDWAPGNLAKARLIAGAFDGKSWKAGVEIVLKGKAHTYWRQPGDGGVPPDFDFSKSANLARATPSFPAPIRSGTPGEEFIGYLKSVVFPITVEPSNVAKPVDLRLTLNYAACEKICVPERAILRLKLQPGQSHPGSASVIAQYEALTPRPLSEADAPTVTIAASEPGKRWRVNVAAKMAQAVDMFVEMDGGWYFETRKEDGGFAVTMVQKPENAGAMPPALLTVTTSRGAFEGKRSLP